MHTYMHSEITKMNRVGSSYLTAIQTGNSGHLVKAIKYMYEGIQKCYLKQDLGYYSRISLDKYFANLIWYYSTMAMYDKLIMPKSQYHLL